MVLSTYNLQGSCKKDFDTEIKFNLATARYEGADLIVFSINKREDEEENTRLLSCIYKILGTVKKAGTISFFVKPEQMEQNTTEAEYIKNKYADYLTFSDNLIYVYVKA